MSYENLPDNIPGTNIWNMSGDECFETTDGEVVNGPLNNVRVHEFPGAGEKGEDLISIQHGNRLYEVEGSSFDKAVREKPCE